MKPLRRRALLAALAASCVAVPAVRPAVAADACTSTQAVFAGDPCDPTTGPYPMMPGLPLVLPPKGPGGQWTDGPPVITPDFTGDVDLVVRTGAFLTGSEIPAPGGAPGGPALPEVVAGGSAQGGRAEFTVVVTDGPGVTPYGSALSGLDERPLAVFGYADLDGDGVVGPTDVDGKADNEIEKQEAIGHVGRQVGQIDVDRFHDTVAVRVGAPASMGGLKVALAAGMYTGDDPGALWTNGTPIFTNWPFFPPLDPVAVVFLDEPNPPDPNGPNILFYRPSEFLLPEPATPGLEEAFALPVDGSNGTTDQFLSLSGPAVGLRLFREIDPDKFVAASRMVIRPAPALVGSGRRMVTPAGEVAVKVGRDVKFRLLPVDALGNIADPGPGGVSARLVADSGLRILSPDQDGDTSMETLNVDSARGVVVKVDTQLAGSAGTLTVFDPPPALPAGLDQAVVRTSTTGDVDSDDDGVPDDGDASGTIGDRPCSPADLADGIGCDDNCPGVVNPSQNDSDGDGQGNCCDGACVLDDADAGCSECPQARSRFRAATSKARLALRPRGGLDDDKVRLRTVLRPEAGQGIAPNDEEVEVTLAEGDRLHWFVQMPGVFTVEQGEKGPIWEYEDGGGSLGGVRRAFFRTRPRGVRVRFQAAAVGLLDTAPAEVLENGLVLTVTVGDDSFTRHLKCTTQLEVIRCVSTN